MRGWVWLVHLGARGASAAALRLRVYGREHVPRQGGAVLASNHQSFLDPFLVGTSLDREVTYMARRSLFGVPVFGAMIRAFGAFPVERGVPDVRGYREAVHALERGALLLVFPEGTRTRTGELQIPKAGVLRIAEHAGVPVVPVLIEGAFQAWPKKNPLPRPGSVNILYGPSERPEEFQSDPAGIHRRWIALRDVPRRGVS